MMAETLMVRKRVADRMVEAGFGPGAIVNIIENRQEQLAVISDVNFCDIVITNAVSKDDYFYGAQVVRYEYVVPKKDDWGDQLIRRGTCYAPLHFMNIDDIPKDQWSREPNNKTCTLLSGVDVSEDTLLTDEAYGNKKKVTKWIIDNLVDPK